MEERTEVRIAGRMLTVANLDKVLYPAAGTTKAALLRYVVAVAEFMLPHLAGRPATLKRFPDGVDASGFFEKRCPDHRPDWVGTVTLPKRAERGEDRGEGAGPDVGDGQGAGGPDAGGVDAEVLHHCDLSEVASLVWAANLAALELHVPMGRAPDPLRPTAVVFDLDPGAPADVLDCARVALRLRELFDRLGLEAWPKTSGGKGLQVYVPTGDAADYEATRGFSRALAQLLAEAEPDRVVAVQRKTERVGKVLVDWAQNHPIKTTICAYSPRARERPTVSTPLTWDEVSDGLDGGDADALAFELDDVVARVGRHGDLFAPVAELTQELPALAPPGGGG